MLCEFLLSHYMFVDYYTQLLIHFQCAGYTYVVWMLKPLIVWVSPVLSVLVRKGGGGEIGAATPGCRVKGKTKWAAKWILLSEKIWLLIIIKIFRKITVNLINSDFFKGRNFCWRWPLWLLAPGARKPSYATEGTYRFFFQHHVFKYPQWLLIPQSRRPNFVHMWRKRTFDMR
jgi:hypothetical protein